MKTFRVVLLSSLISIFFVSAIFAFIYPLNNFSGKTDSIISSSTQLSDSTRAMINNDITMVRNNIITKTVLHVSPAIVGINVTEIQKVRSYRSTDPFYRWFFGDEVYDKPVRSLGSGVIISPDGYIITNDHVAGNASKIVVSLTSGIHYEAEIIGTDLISDICLLKVKAQNLPYVKIGRSDNLLIGEWAIALGNPFGLFEINDKPTVTVGVISAVNMNLGQVENRHYLNMIQTDASINGGNSGGALVNSLGELIGMNTLIFQASNYSGSIGVGFAIPSNKVKSIVDELKEYGKVRRDFWTGISIQSIDEQIANYFGLKDTKGVIVTRVFKDSPADRAGIKETDIIIKFGNFEISNEKILKSVIHEFRTGDEVNLTILRGDKQLIKKMKLETRND